MKWCHQTRDKKEDEDFEIIHTSSQQTNQNFSSQNTTTTTQPSTIIQQNNSLTEKIHQHLQQTPRSSISSANPANQITTLQITTQPTKKMSQNQHKPPTQLNIPTNTTLPMYSSTNPLTSMTTTTTTTTPSNGTQLLLSLNNEENNKRLTLPHEESIKEEETQQNGGYKKSPKKSSSGKSSIRKSYELKLENKAPSSQTIKLFRKIIKQAKI